MAKPTVSSLSARLDELEKRLAARAPAQPAGFSQASDDAAVVLAAVVDGDNLDAPDVAPCLHRLRLHREGVTQDGYPPRVDESDDDGKADEE